MRIRRRLAPLAPVLFLCPVLLAGCPNREVSAVDPDQSREQQKEIPVNLNRNLDILWVVDNSSSMNQEQDALRANFPAFVDVLETIEGGLPNLHMGIVSSDVGDSGGFACPGGDGDDGVLQLKAGCPALDGGVRYIEDIAIDEEGTQREVNYTGTLAEQFSCMADLGTGGCGFEQHLESMRRALTNTTENAGFLRPEAFLAVVFIQDEDDCSSSNGDIFGGGIGDTRDSQFGEYSSYRCFEFGTVCQPADDRTIGPRDECTPDDESQYIESVSTYIDFLRGLKNDPSKVIVAAITGPTAPVNVAEDENPTNNNQLWVQPACVVCNGGGSNCSGAVSSGGDAIVAARPAIRMSAFLDGFPARSTFQSLCNYDPATDGVDLRDALNQIAALFKKVVGTPCLEGTLADGDATAGGVQPDCRVSDVQDQGLETEVDTPIPPCDSSGPPCFRFVEDQTCETPTNVALEIDRGDPPQDPPSNTTVVVRCLVD